MPCAPERRPARTSRFRTALIALLLLKWLHYLSKANWSLSNLAASPILFLAVGHAFSPFKGLMNALFNEIAGRGTESSQRPTSVCDRRRRRGNCSQAGANRIRRADRLDLNRNRDVQHTGRVGPRNESAPCATTIRSPSTMRESGRPERKSVSEVAAVLGVTPTTVLRLIQQKQLPATQPCVGAPWILRRTDVEQCMAEQTNQRPRPRSDSKRLTLEIP